jgi:hypothetical protein
MHKLLVTVEGVASHVVQDGMHHLVPEVLLHDLGSEPPACHVAGLTQLNAAVVVVDTRPMSRLSQHGLHDLDGVLSGPDTYFRGMGGFVFAVIVLLLHIYGAHHRQRPEESPACISAP